MTRDEPGDRPPPRLLDRAPSERYGARVAEQRLAATGPAPSTASAHPLARATVAGLAVAALGAVVHLVAATQLLWTGGLLLIATSVGVAVGLAVRAGAVPRAGGTGAGRRRALAVALAIASLAVAFAASWAGSGQYLGPFDYLAQVYGLLVPLQVLGAAAGALAGTR